MRLKFRVVVTSQGPVRARISCPTKKQSFNIPFRPEAKPSNQKITPGILAHRPLVKVKNAALGEKSRSLGKVSKAVTRVLRYESQRIFACPHHIRIHLILINRLLKTEARAHLHEVKVRITQGTIQNEGPYLGIDFMYHGPRCSWFELNSQLVRNEPFLR